MKVVVLGESPVDQAAVGILAQALVSHVEIVAVHFSFPHVTGVIAVADADYSPIHVRRGSTGMEHVRSRTFGSKEQCRVCDLTASVHRTMSGLRPSSQRQVPLRVAIGLAVPALEAWLLCGRSDIGPSTAKWLTGHMTGRYEYTKAQLKVSAYGSDRASEATMLKAATADALRLSSEIPMLKASFPHGFGILAEALEQWESPQGS